MTRPQMAIIAVDLREAIFSGSSQMQRIPSANEWLALRTSISALYHLSWKHPSSLERRCLQRLRESQATPLQLSRRCLVQPCRKRCIIACYSDLISYEEKATPYPGTVRAIRIC